MTEADRNAVTQCVYHDHPYAAMSGVSDAIFSTFICLCMTCVMTSQVLLCLSFYTYKQVPQRHGVQWVSLAMGSKANAWFWFLVSLVATCTAQSTDRLSDQWACVCVCFCQVINEFYYIGWLISITHFYQLVLLQFCCTFADAYSKTKVCCTVGMFYCFMFYWHRPSVCLSSVCRLSSVVCNVGAPYSGDLNFRQCFYAI